MTTEIAYGTETHCRGCGVEFDTAMTHREGYGPDCQGCHLCFDCAWPDCTVCGDEEGVRLNVEQGKIKPLGFGAVPWKCTCDSANALGFTNCTPHGSGSGRAVVFKADGEPDEFDVPGTVFVECPACHKRDHFSRSTGRGHFADCQRVQVRE